MEFRVSAMPNGRWPGIPPAMVQAVMDAPEQRLRDESRAGGWIYQSRTSKVEKYWSAE